MKKKSYLNRRRKTILHRVEKTEVKNYITPEKTVFKDIHVTILPKETTWLTDPISYPRWVLLLMLAVFIAGQIWGF